MNTQPPTQRAATRTARVTARPAAASRLTPWLIGAASALLNLLAALQIWRWLQPLAFGLSFIAAAILLAALNVGLWPLLRRLAGARPARAIALGAVAGVLLAPVVQTVALLCAAGAC